MRVTWHDNGRGPRIVIAMFDEEFVITEHAAALLVDELTRVLGNIVANRSVPMSDADADAHGGAYREPFDRSRP